MSSAKTFAQDKPSQAGKSLNAPRESRRRAALSPGTPFDAMTP